MSIEERRFVAEPTEVLEDISLEEGNLEKFTRIGTSMKEKTKQNLVRFLRKSVDVFAWSHEDMPGIDPSVITHSRLSKFCSKTSSENLYREGFPATQQFFHTNLAAWRCYWHNNRYTIGWPNLVLSY